MAIAVDQADLGFTLGTAASVSSIAFTSTATVASGGFIVVGVSTYASTSTITGVSGGGLTWTVDKQSVTTGGAGVGMASAQAPSGLASSTTITASFSGSDVQFSSIAGLSFTGVATSSPVDGTAQDAGATMGTGAWTSGSYAIAAGSVLVGMDWQDATVSPSGHTPTSPSVEAYEHIHAVDKYGQALVYRIESSAGSYTVAGTWAVATRDKWVAVAYKAAAGAGVTFTLAPQNISPLRA